MKTFLAPLLLFAVTSAAAQDSLTAHTSLTGSIDAYYRFDTHNASRTSNTNNYTSFTNSQNSFELGMASLKADYSKNRVSATVDLGFGRRAREFSYTDSGVLAAIKQAYISYAPSEHVKFTLGKWATHVGYELVDAAYNRNYSMSYMFSYGPFFHTGVRADFSFGKIGFMVGVANPTDRLSADFQKKFAIAQLSAASDNGDLKAYLNYVGGRYSNGPTVNQFDLVATAKLSGKTGLGYNGTIQLVKAPGQGSDSWWGSALYLSYDPLDLFGLCLRGEYFSDQNAVSGLASSSGTGTNVFEATLSGNVRIDRLTILPEVRIDNAKDAIFIKNNGANAKSTAAFILAAVLSF